MIDTKASVIFIILSMVLNIGIGLLPESAPVIVPAATASITALAVVLETPTIRLIAIMETVLETGINTNLNISSDEIVQANGNNCGVSMLDQYGLKRICSKTDNRLQAIIKAHLVEQASHYTK